VLLLKVVPNRRPSPAEPMLDFNSIFFCGSSSSLFEDDVSAPTHDGEAVNI
jgi:hypothetical protein